MWKKPPVNSYKKKSILLILIMARAQQLQCSDSRSEALAGASWLLSHLHDATTAEAIAIRQGLELVEGLGCQPVIVESDSLEVAQACNGVIEIRSPYTLYWLIDFKRSST